MGVWRDRVYPQPAILRMEMAFIFYFDQSYLFYRNSDILELNEHEVVTENISIFSCKVYLSAVAPATNCPVKVFSPSLFKDTFLFWIGRSEDFKKNTYVHRIML